MIRSFAELKPEQQPQAGGKGATLARLYQRGYPVPDGFVILPAAFEDDQLKPEAWSQAQTHLAQLRRGRADVAFAVRSSAWSEDSAGASFAGEFESVLDARTDDDICQAIGAVRRSRKAARVQAYSQAQGIAQAHEMAVVVQLLVRAEFSGVLFTADPVSGDLMHMTGNAVRGLGEKLVSGQANPQTFTLETQGGKYSGPPEFKPFSKRLYGLALRLDREMGCTQDIEWALAGGKVYILQTRPVTTLREFNPATGEINSSMTGDFLWSNGNAAEIHPEVMTLLSWSVIQLWGYGYAMRWSRYPLLGNIGGRFYFNISIQVAPLARVPGIGLRSAMRFVGDWWGRIPKDVTAPLTPFSLTEIFFKILPMMMKSFRQAAASTKQIPDFVSKTPAWCHDLRGRIGQLNDCAALAVLWRDELGPYYYFGTAMASVANSSAQIQLQAELSKLVGEADANALLSNLGGGDYLASLGPVVNLARVARGEMSRAAYLEQYGHRSPYEFDLARSQPMDDPAWLDRQLADFARAPFDVDAALEKQRANYAAAWERFCARHPRKVKKIQHELAAASDRARLREAARSEATRVMSVVRCFALRAGELTGLGEEVFHLTMDELLAALGGDRSACAFLPARKETYRRYCALPPYPPVISGRFDPFAWAADPQRRADVYDAHTTSLPLPTSNVITGFAGAAGVVEGRARRIDHVEDSALLQPGEILVTMTTNVGWTPLFPRAAAIVTDIGAPLSHAAIVARELGIPAVVGCNDATMRLKTGDRLRVDGGKGTVEILESQQS
jgi:pyruvate,water dikinase